MGLKSWAIARVLLTFFKHLHKGGTIHDAVQAIDTTLDAAFPKRSEQIQQQFVAQLLMPLAEGLMEEDTNSMIAMYRAAAKRLAGED